MEVLFVTMEYAPLIVAYSYAFLAIFGKDKNKEDNHLLWAILFFAIYLA